jgi:hypothetical protein
LKLVARATDGSLKVTVTVEGPLGVGVKRFTVAEPEAPEVAVALTVTAAGLGSEAGAVYRPLELIVPYALPPVTDQAMVWLGVTTAVNCWVCAGAPGKLG